MKNHILCLFLLVLISVALPLAASARISESGECGFNRTWTLDDSGLLIISGKGPVINHPWSSSKVIKVVIESGITRIGDSVFEKCSNLKNMTIPKSVISIGNKSIPQNTSNLTIQCYFDSTAHEYAKSNNINVVLLDEKPVITSQPSDMVVDEGKTATFKVVATGATEYQWYCRTSSTVPWKKVANNGASATISFKAKDNYNEYQFRCLVKNSAGSVYSQIASLKVIPESSNPATTSNVELGESKLLTIGTNNDKIQKEEVATVISMPINPTESPNEKLIEDKSLTAGISIDKIQTVETGTTDDKIQTAESETRNIVPSALLWLGLLIFLVILVLSLSIPKIQRSHVKHYSTLYNGLLSLNKKYCFYKDIPDSYSLTHTMKSKHELEEDNADEILLYEMENDSTLKTLFERINFNRLLYPKYIEEYKEIKRENIYNGKLKYNKKIERKMCEEIIQEPIQDIKIILKLELLSSEAKNDNSSLYYASYYNLLYAHEKLYIKNNSTLYSELLSLNERYCFYDIPVSYSLTHRVNSKQAFDTANVNEIFLYDLYYDSTSKAIFEKLTHNRSLYKKYIEEYNRLKENSIPDDKINTSIEQQMCEKIILNPIQDININLKLEYISSGGNKHYSRSYSASYKNLSYVYTEVPRREISRYQAQVERSKMSAALRYQVLTRDGHRCVICGATAQDGVKLHVDHIVPVSKGGKTELSNLRTLCDRCNLGKGDKYDANGLN